MTTLPAQAATDRRAALDVACTHCGLPVPAGLVEARKREAVLLRRVPDRACRDQRVRALDAYYELRRRIEADPTPARHRGHRFAEFDDPAFAERHVREMPDGLRSCELYLEGVHCAACVWLVERLSRVVPGVIAARLDLGRSLVHASCGIHRRRCALSGRTGHRSPRLSTPPRDAAARARESRRQADRAALIRIGVAGACMGNVMLLAAALYSGMLDGIEESTRHAFPP
jgi:Cu2+-exporting ATPase